MEKGIIIAIIVLVILLIIIPVIYFIVQRFSKKYKKYCDSNKDCKKDEECQYLRSVDQKICVPKGSQDCSITDINQLVSCDLDNDNCGKLCNNFPSFSCLEVSKGSIEIVKKGSNYEENKKYTTSTNTNESGSGMKIIVKKIDSSGGILISEIAESGFGYKLNQTLNVVGGNNDSQLKITSLEKNSYISIGKEAINLPDTEPGKGYCLPNIENNYNCNPATSLDILVSKGNGQYEWGCQCLYPNYFTHIKSDGLSSCDRISREICGGDENNDGSKLFYIPETDSSGNIIKCYEKCTNSNSTCVSKIDASYCYIPWEMSKMDIDPKYGVCMCPSGSAFIDDSKDGNISKNCVSNPCYPGKMIGTTSNYSCNCDKTENKGNYISCLALQQNPINLKLKQKCQVFGDRCYPDPCGLGKWSSDTKGCVCSPSPGPTIGAVNDDNIVGETCENVCQVQYNSSLDTDTDSNPSCIPGRSDVVRLKKCSKYTNKNDCIENKNYANSCTWGYCKPKPVSSLPIDPNDPEKYYNFYDTCSKHNVGIGNPGIIDPGTLDNYKGCINQEDPDPDPFMPPAKICQWTGPPPSKTNLCPSGSNCKYIEENSGEQSYRGILCSPCPKGRCNFDGRQKCDIDFTTPRNCQGYFYNN